MLTQGCGMAVTVDVLMENKHYIIFTYPQRIINSYIPCSERLWSAKVDKNG